MKRAVKRYLPWRQVIGQQRDHNEPRENHRIERDANYLRTLRDSLQAPGTRLGRIVLAQQSGKADGLADRHYHESRLSEFSAGEITAWLAGWREGQAELKAHRAEIKRLMEDIAA